MKVGIIGSGGREHAICHFLSKSKKIKKIYCIPGNAGTSSISENINLDINNHLKIKNFIKKNKIDLVIVGPERPLVEGLVDYLENNEIKVFGPNKKSSKLEGSKIFTKKLCKKYNIPTANFKIFNNLNKSKKFLLNTKYPLVIKADNLASGKGVYICKNKQEAINSVKEIFGGKFGKAKNVLVEEFLNGEEMSYFIISDGKTIKNFGTAQDHKRVGEGDTGKNTGGMGAYSPAPIVDEKIHQKIIDEVMTPTVHGLISEGSPYLGFLYAGLMIKDGEIKVLEFNCRFGDPETQPILLRLKSSLVELCLAAINDELESHEIEWTEKHSCGVVIASQGYPENYESNKLVSLPNSTENETKLFHAGTKLSNNEVLTSGGRVFCATALGDNLKEAQAKAYNLVDQVSFEGAFFRKDIGFKGIK